METVNQEAAASFEAAIDLTSFYGQDLNTRSISFLDQDLKTPSAWRQHAGQYFKMPQTAGKSAQDLIDLLKSPPVNYWINSFDWRHLEIDRLIASTKEAAAARPQGG